MIDLTNTFAYTKSKEDWEKVYAYYKESGYDMSCCSTSREPDHKYIRTEIVEVKKCYRGVNESYVAMSDVLYNMEDITNEILVGQSTAKTTPVVGGIYTMRVLVDSLHFLDKIYKKGDVMHSMKCFREYGATVCDKARHEYSQDGKINCSWLKVGMHFDIIETISVPTRTLEERRAHAQECINNSLLDSNQLKDMNKLAQLKFDNYIKANQKSVIALSEKMDTNLEPINIMGIFLGQVHSDIRNANSSMESYYESGNKDGLETAQTRAKKIERFLDSVLFHELTLILKDAEDVYTKLTK